MSFDTSIILEAVFGSAVGAAATFVGIWFLFFRARIEAAESPLQRLLFLTRISVSKY